MGKELNRLRKRKKIIKQLDCIFENANTSLVIHYSCESFYEKTDGKTPRITSIAVRNLESGQTDSFSIHQVAEEHHIEFSDITNKYDSLEREMLNRYFEFLNTHQHCNWIHWNMRDVNYGFQAIEHRYRALGGTPIQLNEDKKFDLSRAIISLYGVSYIGHPRLPNLLEKNNITHKDFLTGEEEAKAFDNKDFVKLHRSTLRKVDTLANIIERTYNQKLKTNSTWLEQHGYSFTVLLEIIKSHPFFTFLTILIVILALIEKSFNVFNLLGK